MNSLQVEYFLELCRTLNFTKAANNLFVSQPAVSKQISALEKELGVQLFLRDHKVCQLTPAGEIIYKFLERTVCDYKKTLKEAHELIKGETQSITIGFLEGWDLSRYLPKITKLLLGKYPDITINFVSYNYERLNEEIENKNIDIGISLSDNFYNIAKAKKKGLTSIPVLLFFSASHPFANKNNIQMSDFKNETFFVFSNQSKMSSKDKVVEICKIHGFIPYVSVVPNIESMMLNVQNGFGVALFDEWIQYKHNPVLRKIKTGHKHKIVVTWNDYHLDNIVDFFIDQFILLLKDDKKE